MHTIDQDSAIRSLQQALIPAPGLIDGRTEKDWLNFLSGFAGLLNFYDLENNKNGTWAPFILKDPLFLTASITGTPFSRYHNLYLDTVAKLKEYIATPGNTPQTALRFNHLFNQLNDVFVIIKHWIHRMQMSADEYPLKTYIIHEATTTISPFFWALNSLRQNLYISQFIEGITAVDATRFPSYSHYEEKVWKQNKDRNPFWDVLGLKHPIAGNSPVEILIAVTAAGDLLFRFFNNIIHHAGQEFEKIKNETGSYPDTVLLRTFINLLQIHQDQLNDISAKHLSFYYNDILKQKPLGAVVDSAYLYLTLSGKEPFILPAGTQFNAGTDADKKPILFATTANTPLNTAIITGASTLSVLPASASGYAVYLNTIKNPTAIQTDEDGTVLPWQTFGGAALPDAKTNTGIAIASPILLLREGNRNIDFTFTFAQEYDFSLLKDAQYYLSTKQQWLNVTAAVCIPDYCNRGQQLTVQVQLDESQPAIEAFTKNPDNIESRWPMLKMVFSNITKPGSPPVVTELSISVAVTGMKNISLNNDYGPLNTKSPYLPFGPAPVYSSSFIIGSDEIFSKPLNTLYFSMDWNNLPEFGFDSYYEAYNQYLTAHTEELGIPPNTKRLNIFQRLWRRFHRTENNLISVFNNLSFTVGFQQLQNSTWQDINVTDYQSLTVNNNGSVTTTLNPAINKCSAPPDAEGIQLFNTLYNEKTDKCDLEPSSYFGYIPQNSTNADTSIQQEEPFLFTENSSNGFIRMVIKGPERFGFGFQMYPKVVADVAMQNANLLMKKPSDPVFKASANMPFAPALNTVTAHYTASITHNLTNQTGMPVQCFSYTPFSTYKIFDSTNPVVPFTTMGNSGSVPAGLQLFSPVYYSGLLFLEMENVATSALLNIYAEMAGNFGAAPTQQSDYYYLSATGWKPLPLVADETNNFSCPGIITVNLPEDMACNTTIMPGKNYCIAIAVKGDASSYGKIIAVYTNGAKVTRILPDSTAITATPQIDAGAIQKTQTPIPQIGTVTQPFPSFGGKPAEDGQAMNYRVSNRLKNKDRIVSPEDYARAINNEFPDIYYSKPVFNIATRSTSVYVIKQYKDIAEANALLPLTTTCEQSKITGFVQQRVAAFNKITVNNFNFQYVQVTADILIKTGYECLSVQKAVNTALKAFMAPWIAGNTTVYNIGEPITDALVTQCIRNIDGVLEVQQVTLSSRTDAVPQPVGPLQAVTANAPDLLLVSTANHIINCNRNE